MMIMVDVVFLLVIQQDLLHLTCANHSLDLEASPRQTLLGLVE